MWRGTEWGTKTQEVRNHVARLMLQCTINELFDWRFMQTDPNWGNFLFDRETGQFSPIHSSLVGCAVTAPLYLVAVLFFHLLHTPFLIP